ncbi:MAG TPA: L-rhamnose mutarotase [Candidatus Borkfalkia excrementigallinarum]|uniref:L-rhamnose mutarotase n=1 Tax=Candidatus Borkfalkia excrementigallinarum TaxID=2838506 RepID=A0A9D1ZWM2_9FIRM|nr:L-rhamnose mutarotase [Candidatus Borkfalkia excrementigallinarum]
MEKIVWRATVREGMKEEYIRRHNEIWPDMVKALKEAGICNYTIWMDGDELFGYYECEKGAEYALKYQAENETVLRWEKSMEPIMQKRETVPAKVFDLQ